VSALEVFGLEDNILAERMALGTMPGDEIAEPMDKLLAWTPDRGWLAWNDHIWSSISEPEAVEHVRAELKRWFAILVTQKGVTEKDAKHYAKLLTATKAKNVAYFLKGLLTVPTEKFDADPLVVNCLNGVFDIRTKELLQPDPRMYITKSAGASYNRNAQHDDWDKVREAIPEDKEQWLQVRYGQAITGYPVDDDVLPIQTGGGSNGKTSMVAACVAAAGSYGVFVPEKVLLAGQGEHPTELMTLRGARLAVIEETPEGKHLPTKRLKDLIGTPIMTARLMRQDFVHWNASHSLFLNTNYVPQVSETDHGTWRRLALVKFPFKFVDPEDPLMGPNERHGDPGLRDRIRYNTDDQLEAVLAWMIDGAVAWYEMGRRQWPLPISVQDDTAAWRAETDLVLAYARERLTFDPEGSVLSTEFFDDFTDWLKSNGRQTWNNQTFADRFMGHELFEDNNVTKGQIAVPLDVSRRYPSTLSVPVSGKKTVWKGVRFN
jgi:putative DNA primase/helicase